MICNFRSTSIAHSIFSVVPARTDLSSKGKLSCCKRNERAFSLRGTGAPKKNQQKFEKIKGGSRTLTVLATASAQPLERLPDNVTNSKVWEEMSTYLTSQKVKGFSPSEAYKRTTGFFKYKLIDVRPNSDFSQVHARGANNVQLYRPLTSWDVKSTLARVTLAMLTPNIPAVEENPAFLEEMRKITAKGDRIIVVCDSGGTLEPTASLKYGKQSRSLIAAYLLLKNGYKNISFVEGGMGNWIRGDLPCDGEGPSMINKIYSNML